MEVYGKWILTLTGVAALWIIWHYWFKQNIYSFVLLGAIVIYVWRKYISHKN